MGAIIGENDMCDKCGKEEYNCGCIMDDEDIESKIKLVKTLSRKRKLEFIM